MTDIQTDTETNVNHVQKQTSPECIDTCSIPEKWEKLDYMTTNTIST